MTQLFDRIEAGSEAEKMMDVLCEAVAETVCDRDPSFTKGEAHIIVRDLVNKGLIRFTYDEETDQYGWQVTCGSVVRNPLIDSLH